VPGKGYKIRQIYFAGMAPTYKPPGSLFYLDMPGVFS